MGIYMGGKEYQKMYIGGKEISQLNIGGKNYKTSTPTGPVRSILHTFSIVAGAASWGIGYNDGGSLGSILRDTYNPGGGTVTIRQFVRLSSGNLRLILNRLNLTVADIDQFPDRIEVESSTGSIAVFIRHDPNVIAQHGKGPGIDYEQQSGDSSTIFVNGQTVTVRLYEPIPVPDAPGILTIKATRGSRSATNWGAILEDADGIKSVTSAVHTASDGRTANRTPIRTSANRYAFAATLLNIRWRSGSFRVVYTENDDSEHTVIANYDLN